MHLFAILFLPIFGLGFSLFSAFHHCGRAEQADLVSIFVLNFLLGWTAIGWVIALVWALKADVPMAVR